MSAFWWVVREIYSLRETLTKNFEVNSTNVTESNERTNERTDERQGENYKPLGINAGGIISPTFNDDKHFDIVAWRSDHNRVF